MSRQCVLATLCLVALAGGIRPLQAADAPLVSEERAADVQDILVLGPSRPVLLRLHITIDGQPFREVWQARLELVLANEDHDGDGQLTIEEARRVGREMDGRLGESFLGPTDKPAGETISREALTEMLERAVPPVVLRPRAVIGQGSALALFPLLDTSGDQRLTADELAAAEVQLMQRDFDDNGVLTPGELILDPKAIAAAAEPGSEGAAIDPNESPVLILDTLLSGNKFAERLLKHYDRDRDGMLATSGTSLEIKLPDSTAGRWDANQDGKLSHEELQSAQLWPPDMELTFAMGQASARAGRSARMPRHPDGFTARKKLLGGYDLDLGEAKIDFDRNNRDPRQADLVRMQQYDRDGNKYLDLAEAGTNNISPASFAAMDIDGDGKVFKGELTSYISAQNEAAASRLYLVVKDKGQDLFQVLETETDGLLSPRELRSAKSVLDLHDSNGDGVLGGDEVPEQLEFELVRGVDERTDADTFVRYSTLASSTQAAESGPLWFGKMDRNRDGDLSPQEFVGPRQAFDALDADADGLIDRSEAEAAGKK